ncbi:STAS domain-containing protein [Shewanella sp. 3B26]|uniref:STAS domain-containing protein n=1 Tax=Shewanella zhuhaiensis TaxID=2919576 RepID=A0AAJ1BJ76_9GAMM|nr:STAS domain-containing protein [Shewanella zhuhaiensis]MCH4295768.1 STAS domain-containing protein [Shewanella zhuhaiensis]
MISLTLNADRCEVSGRLDHGVVRDLWPRLDELIPAGATRLDLRQLSYSDSAGIAFLLELWQRAQNRGQKLQLVSPSAQLAKLIALYDLEAFFVEEA